MTFPDFSQLQGLVQQASQAVQAEVPAVAQAVQAQVPGLIASAQQAATPAAYSLGQQAGAGAVSSTQDTLNDTLLLVGIGGGALLLIGTIAVLGIKGAAPPKQPLLADLDALWGTP